MKEIYLKYKSEEEAKAHDLTDEKIISVVYVGFEVITHGDEENEPVFGTDYMVHIMTTEPMYFENQFFPKRQWHTFAGLQVEDEVMAVTSDIGMGNYLIDTFLIDNEKEGIELNEEIIEQLTPLKVTAENGEIVEVKSLLEQKEEDDIFTEERLNKYIQMCDEHTK